MVEIIDGYLLAAVLLIFALGLYELFISRIDVVNKDDEHGMASNVLIINSLDDLKTRLAKVILMILIVRFFENAISMNLIAR
ncbi:MAG TPA: YqhA family protein [Gammaproteobacteria bacterium]